MFNIIALDDNFDMKSKKHNLVNVRTIAQAKKAISEIKEGYLDLLILDFKLIGETGSQMLEYMVDNNAIPTFGFILQSNMASFWYDYLRKTDLDMTDIPYTVYGTKSINVDRHIKDMCHPKFFPCAKCDPDRIKMSFGKTIRPSFASKSCPSCGKVHLEYKAVAKTGADGTVMSIHIEIEERILKTGEITYTLKKYYRKPGMGIRKIKTIMSGCKGEDGLNEIIGTIKEKYADYKELFDIEEVLI